MDLEKFKYFRKAYFPFNPWPTVFRFVLRVLCGIVPFLGSDLIRKNQLFSKFRNIFADASRKMSICYG